MTFRHVRTEPLRPEAPFVIFHAWELRLARQLGDWALSLFSALVEQTAFDTGEGKTTYAQLQGLLTPDQPERGPRLTVRTRDEIKNMVSRMESIGLLERFTVVSRQAQLLFFRVAARSSVSTSAGKPTREPTRARKAQNPVKHGENSVSSTETDPRTDPSFQQNINTNTACATPPPVDKSEAVERINRTRDALAAKTQKLSPKGGLNVARSGGHAPHKTNHKAPRGGQGLTPPTVPTAGRLADALRVPMAMNTGLECERRAISDPASGTTAARAGPQEGAGATNGP